MNKTVNLEQIKRIKSGRVKKSDYNDFTDKEIAALQLGKDYVTKKGEDGLTSYEYMQEILECSPELQKIFDEAIEDE